MKSLVLVVDPDADTRDLYRESFERNGCEVVEATDGRDALTKALVRPPALVVTEIVLPFLDGCGLCEILRRDRATTNVPILAVTADARPGGLRRVQQSGANAVLVKPTTPEQMWMETQRLLGAVADVHGRAAGTNGDADDKRQQPERPHASLTKTFSRFTTTTPAVHPPALLCPSCGQPLVYEQSYVGGVSERHREQWDRYACTGMCGEFQYRQRTRKLNHLE